MKTSYLHTLGVYGYGDVEPIVLAALVTGDPLLLVGRAGTGKTFLLNSLSEALRLEHRHYNASLIAFDDLVGFPYPEPDTSGIRYLETPATVWKAESVLVDEINRCKPEHQNRLFSLVHERRIQGLKLEKLRYCWAAMNPTSIEQNGATEFYSGCEPLDAALADRFAFVVTVADWEELSREDQRLIADPRSDGAIFHDDGSLASFIEAAGVRFAGKLREPDPIVIDYCREAATALGEAGVRISPRRVRQVARNILAVESVSKLPRERLFQLALRWSLPQRTGAQPPGEEVVRAVHWVAWDAVCSDGPERWLYDFHREPDLVKKIAALLTTCECPDTGTLAVSQLLAVEDPDRAATFALAIYPLLLCDPGVKIGPEGIKDLGNLANDILDLHGERTWREQKRVPLVPAEGAKWDAEHPDFAPCARVLETLRDGRKERAEQLFGHLLLRKIEIKDAVKLEEQLHRCVIAVRNYQKAHDASA